MLGNFIQVNRNTIVLQVQVQPKSSKNGWGRLAEKEGNQWIQLKITSPPVDGAANKSCIKFIAKEFKTAKSKVKILQGEKSRLKIIQISDFDRQKLQNFIDQYLPS